MSAPTLRPTARAAESTRARFSGDAWLGAVLVTPAMLALVLFVVTPGLLAFVATMFEIDLSGRTEWEWAGLDNVRAVMTDPAVLQSLANTLIYSVLTIVPSLVIGLALALLANSLGRGRPLVRTLLFLPFTANLVAMAVVFRFIFDLRGGLANTVLGLAGVGPINFLGDTATALPTVAAVGVWRCAALAMILFLAGLTSIPTAVHEAAAADGISGWVKLRWVVLPLLKPITIFVTVLMILQSVQVFDTINVMTQGGPLGSTETVLTMVWRLGFTYYDLGQGAALSTMLLILLIAVGILRRRSFSGESR
ncbi:sugar ABC transporter permease [Pseudonocardia sp. NPDC046786]|uniref:carbohydrate ABC transporter permease n=1 Tax=Pseudonocardia sp. NPDC046786 TaxID=3155471 RepID=UPI0033EDBB8D